MRHYLPAFVTFCLLSLAVGTSASAAATVRSGSITATVGGSESEPPGLLVLDLGNGRFQLAPLPSPRASDGLNFVQVQQGRIASAELQQLRTASLTLSSTGW